MDICPESLEESTCNLTVDMASELHQEGVIENGLHDHLMVIHKSFLKRVPDNPLPVFEAKEH